MDSVKKAKHQCKSCKKVLTRSERLTKHIEKGRNRATCTVCHEKFRDVKKLEAHQRKHDAEALSRCTTCSKKFNRSRDLISHQRNADPKVCEVCNTTFCHQSELERHKRTVHVGQGVSTDVDEQLDQPIYPETLFEEDEGYKEEIANHWNEIIDRESSD